MGVGAIVRPLLRRRTVFLVIETKPALILVEDDLSVLRALRRLMLSAGFKVMAFDRPRAVLDSELPKTDACLIVDVHLPEMNGVQLGLATLTASMTLSGPFRSTVFLLLLIATIVATI